jgi:CBS-domain-containing membrane protein
MDKKIYLSIMAALAAAAAVWLFALLLAPIAKPLAWALIIGIATLPHHDRLVRKFPHHPNRSAGLMVLAISLSRRLCSERSAECLLWVFLAFSWDLFSSRSSSPSGGM